MAVRYMYKGIPLSQFCKEKNISYNTVTKRIYKFLKNGEPYDINQIVDSVMKIQKREVYSTYNYKGLPLKEYCKVNNIKYEYISFRITSLRKKEEYKSKPLNELIDIIINKYETTENKRCPNAKYFYKDMLLTDYCRVHKLTYTYVVKSILSLEKQEPMLSLQEVIEKVVTSITSQDRIRYHGEVLYDYCQKNGLDYRKILARAKRFKTKEKYIGYSWDELVSMAIEYKRTYHTKYYYKGVPLVKYCKENNLNYQTTLQRINDLKNKKEFKNLSLEEIIDRVLKNSESKNPQYYYQGMKLKEYCESNGLNYQTIRKKLRNLKKEAQYSGYSIEELITIVINQPVTEKKIILYYGQSLQDYCKENNLNFSYIKDVYYKKKSLPEYEGCSVEEILEETITRLISRDQLYYEGVTLKQYCKEHNLKYDFVSYKYSILKRTKKYCGLSEKELIEESLKAGIKEGKAKHMYKGAKLMKYCLENDYNYHVVVRKINELKKDEKNINLSDDELTEMALEQFVKTLPENINGYLYNGQPLLNYCLENEIEYTSVINAINNLKETEGYGNYSIDEIIYFVLICKGTPPCKVHYKGKPFNVYCKENDIDYNAVRQRINFLKRTGKYEDLKEEELIDIALSDKYKPLKYTLDGVPITKYCNQQEVDPTLVKIKISILKRSVQYRKYTMEMMVKEIVAKEKNKKLKK